RREVPRRSRGACAARHRRKHVHAPPVTKADDFVKRARSRLELEREAEALRAFGVNRAPAVRAVRVDTGELVLERVHPGEPIASIAPEDEALRIVAQLFDTGWPSVPSPSIAQPLATFARALDGNQPVLRPAAGLLRELLHDARDQQLLHGDLHYDNILS